MEEKKMSALDLRWLEIEDQKMRECKILCFMLGGFSMMILLVLCGARW